MKRCDVADVMMFAAVVMNAAGGVLAEITKEDTAVFDFKEFTYRMLEVDSLCEVELRASPFHDIRIRPSHPRYRDRLVEAALAWKPAGVALYVAREAYELEVCKVPERPYLKPSWRMLWRRR